MSTIRLFGFDINQTQKPTGQSPIPPDSNEPSTAIAGGFYGHYQDLADPSRNDFDLIKRYRNMSMHHEVDSAIDQIVNEFLVTDTNDSPIEINLEKSNLSNTIKKKIKEEFKYILRMLDFENKAHEIIRSWYIDGRIFYHKVIDHNDHSKGILELRYIDSLKLKKKKVLLDQAKGIKLEPYISLNMNQETDPYQKWIKFWEYSPTGNFYNNNYQLGNTNMFRNLLMTHGCIAHSYSGLQDMMKRINLSYLHKAIKPLNQLRMIEDSIVIYRVSRGPERRLFYIDVGSMPTAKAEQYLAKMIGQFKQKMAYDSDTGEVRDDKKHMSILEDYWLARREGSKGTEISTLPGGQNLGELKDVEYFKKALYSSLNLPPSRLTDDNKGFNLGKTTEVLRDEIMFTKFVGLLRKRFSSLFNNILRDQLIFKKIIGVDDWEEIKEHIQYDYLHDNHFNELKEAELMKMQMETVNLMNPYVGRYFSVEYIRKKYLNQSETDMQEIDKQMKQEGIEYVDFDLEGLEIDKMAAETDKKEAMKPNPKPATK